MWSSGNSFASKERGLRFKSQTGQIGHSVAKDLPPQQSFFKKSYVARRLNDAERGPANLSHASA